MVDYGEHLKTALIRKINKAERELYQLKLDYCRFVYGISHRSKVSLDDAAFQVKSVDLDSMERNEEGDWTKPNISGVRLDNQMQPLNAEIVALGQDWSVLSQ